MALLKRDKVSQVENNAMVSVTNNLVPTLFKSIKATLNNTQIVNSADYHILNYWETKLQATELDKVKFTREVQ